VRELRAHRVTLMKNELGQVISARCEDCGANLSSPQEHHEPEHCLLVQHKFNPEDFVRRASSRLRRHDPSYGSHPAVRAARAIPMMAAK